MKRLQSITAVTLSGLMGVTIIGTPLAASASEEGKRNTGYALGALAATLLLTQRNKVPGLLAAGGAAYAFSQLGGDRDRRWRTDRYRTNDDSWRGRQNDDNWQRRQNDDNRYPQENNGKGGSFRYRLGDNNQRQDNRQHSWGGR